MNISILTTRMKSKYRAAVIKAKSLMDRPSVMSTAHVCTLAGIGILVVTGTSDAMAQSTTAMPWEGPLCAVANSMRSTVAKAAAIIAIVIAGLAMAFGELNGIFKTLMALIAGTSMALLATSWLNFLGGGSTFC